MPDRRGGPKLSAQLYWNANLARDFEGPGGVNVDETDPKLRCNLP